ncbi:MAG: hypothetical protein GEU91_16060 [Rhizobiales bacterium]|nr:hypothetical protein [Hyphomicrobiales bacterium]
MNDTGKPPELGNVAVEGRVLHVLKTLTDMNDTTRMHPSRFGIEAGRRHLGFDFVSAPKHPLTRGHTISSRQDCSTHVSIGGDRCRGSHAASASLAGRRSDNHASQAARRSSAVNRKKAGKSGMS